MQRKTLLAFLVTVVAVMCLSAPADATDNKALVERFVAAGNERALEKLDAIVAANFVRHCQATPGLDVRSLEQFKAFMREDAAVFPDSRVSVHHMIAENDFVAVWATYAGTQEGQMGPFPASGKHMELDFGAVFRIAEEKIAELWVTWDNLAALTQLGHFPPPPAGSPEDE